MDSPAGQGEDLFRLPWAPGELPQIRSRPGEAVRDVAPAAEGAAETPPREIGEALYQALFSGQVGTLWTRSLGLDSRRGLRLQLRFRLGLGDPESAFLQSLPWELLYASDARDFLALSRATPVVRYLEVPRPLPPAALPGVLRVLAVVSHPRGLTPLELERERSAIREAWKGRRDADVVFLDRPQPGAVREALLRHPFQVLHFMGHGKLDRRTGAGQLFFEESGGGPVAVSGEDLATQLKDIPGLRLVFLNACDTAAVAGGELDPFAGVATALVLAGIPAVIAMQMPVSDRAAVAFCRAVHSRLAAGDPLDAAVTEGRQAIRTVRPGTAEWAVPVLFTRVADGRIFSPVRKRGRHVWAFAAGIVTVLLAVFLTWVGRLSEVPLPVDPPELKKVRLGSIRVGVYEVTRSEFLSFVLAKPEWRQHLIGKGLHDGDYLQPWPTWREFPAGTADHPVTHVSWYAADAFCRWLHGRLPTRAEWQKVAHTSRQLFPWGQRTRGPSGQVPLNFCDRDCPGNDRDPELEDGFPETAPVGSFPDGATPEGVFDLSGNVWEWTADVSGAQRVTMGGSYLSTFDECSTDEPGWEDPKLAARDGGFRCVWD